MKATILKVAIAVAVAVPVALTRADDEKKTDEKKEVKRVEVKVLRLDGHEGGRPKVKVLRSELGEPAELKVIELDGTDGKAAIKVFVDGQLVGERAGEKQPYLGVGVEPVPPALVAHLPGLVSKEQGLLVSRVAADSPTGKAGLKEHDILVTYDDQKLFSGEQLIKLVRGDKAGREVTLGVVRAGKPEKVEVTLGEREAPRGIQIFGGEPGKGRRIELPVEGERREELRRILEKHGLDDKPAPGAKAQAQVKSNFSSMKLESLDGERFKAEIEYKNEKGDSLKRSFEGTRDEIRKEIEADKEMPEPIRNQLLRSLDLGKGGKGAYHFNMPRGGFWIDSDWSDFFGNMPDFKFPDSKEVEQIIEQLYEDLDPETREKLKGAIRKIEPPKAPVERDRPL